MLSKKQAIFFFLTYAALRVFSFYFQPGSIANNVLAAAILLTAVYWLIRKDERGWLIVAGEIILGGAGNFTDIGGISIRSLLLAASVLIYFIHKIRSGRLAELLQTNKQYVWAISVLYVWVIFSAVNGYVSGHTLRYIVSEIIPYFFFLYYFPLKELLTSEKFCRTALAMLAAAVCGSLIFMLVTFIGYSSGAFVLFDPYYHWFRDVANGKITEYPLHYYRLVLNEQLLLVPLAVYFIGQLIKKFSWLAAAIATSLLFILGINITRIYILALLAGLLFLFSKQNWKRWLAYAAAASLIFFSSFTVIHLAASRGQSLGWEFFGLRLQSMATPSMEDSSLSRMLLLPKIMEKIQRHPLFGGGLGDAVTVYSPVLQATITTSQFDWGYLQMADELGILGLIIWMLVLYTLFRDRFKQTKMGLIAPLCALLIINTTSPALFHVLGVILIVFLAARQAVLLPHG